VVDSADNGDPERASKHGAKIARCGLHYTNFLRTSPSIDNAVPDWYRGGVNIGFDAKRAVFNQTGLGNYARTLIESLATAFPENRYILYTPVLRENQRLEALRLQPAVSLATPRGWFGKLAPGIWRIAGIAGQARADQVSVFHGLSNEMPVRLNSAGIKSVVTIHDVIFERLPELYRSHDRMIYRFKTKHACRAATAIVAVSQQSKADLVEFFRVEPERIRVIYQSCDPSFGASLGDSVKAATRQKYRLPAQYLLYVGSIEKRKNLLTLVKAVELLRKSHDPYLVALGNGKEYLQEVTDYIERNGLSERVRIISDAIFADFPAIYQSAIALAYPSLFEGFGIPILEALWSKVPVITTKGGCFAEAGGPASLYVDSQSPEELAHGIKRILENSTLRAKMIAGGLGHAQKFHSDKVAAEMMALYRGL